MEIAYEAKNNIIKSAPLYRTLFKRIFDLCASVIVFLILLPLFITLMAVLFFEFKGKPFFIQSRPGKDEKEIRIIKFRSMNNATDNDGNLLPNHLRITKLGGFLRRTSLDEIPQLINVIKGDISLVGPRPLLFKYIPLYNESQRRRHEIRPGITGWAQVNGRNAISWAQKFEYDTYYVDNHTFKMDLKIILLTLKKVVISEGVNASDKITMPPFDGSN